MQKTPTWNTLNKHERKKLGLLVQELRGNTPPHAFIAKNKLHVTLDEFRQVEAGVDNKNYQHVLSTLGYPKLLEALSAELSPDTERKAQTIRQRIGLLVKRLRLGERLSQPQFIKEHKLDMRLDTLRKIESGELSDIEPFVMQLGYKNIEHAIEFAPEVSEAMSTYVTAIPASLKPRIKKIVIDRLNELGWEKTSRTAPYIRPLNNDARANEYFPEKIKPIIHNILKVNAYSKAALEEAAAFLEFKNADEIIELAENLEQTVSSPPGETQKGRF